MIYSQHYCTRCRKYFNADMTDLASPGSHYTTRVVDTAVRLVIEDGLPYRTASWSLWRDHRVFVPYATIQNWVEDGGKRHSGESTPTTSTGHSPTSRALSPLTSCMTARSVSSRSSITAPSNGCPTTSWTATRPKPTSRLLPPLPPGLGGARVDPPGDHDRRLDAVPEPIATVFGEVPHQLCPFHILHEVNKAVLSAVAKERKVWRPGPQIAAGPSRLEGGEACRPAQEADQAEGG